MVASWFENKGKEWLERETINDADEEEISSLLGFKEGSGVPDSTTLWSRTFVTIKTKLSESAK